MPPWSCFNIPGVVIKHMKTLFLISFFVLSFNFSNAQRAGKVKASDTLYFKFTHQKNQEIKYQGTVSNDTIGSYYFNYLSKDHQHYVIFTFIYSKHPIRIMKKSILRKRRIKYIDYSFLKNKSTAELGDFFKNKVVILIDTKETKGCEVILKPVIYQSSAFYDM
jgi:hypothetical protein